jgi:hypothetical protein
MESTSERNVKTLLFSNISLNPTVVMSMGVSEEQNGFVFRMEVREFGKGVGYVQKAGN